ncbi:YIPF1 homolog [Olea europaea subsp. europaea]|uniref:Protein YIP n=1 Tax=Olea europaea subsp. europaea TaxID=158383 RepID=A0A8S0UVA1_OLEEU|nr:YIPF1 homolog [Olea europaea subsp. europaea]
MDESFSNLPTSYLLGSVPAVVSEEKTPSSQEDGDEQQSTNNWKGVFSISSYTQYFNVDTDVVLNRLISSLYPISGDFFSKIDANPDLYGLVWISTTLVFAIASLGNCATYLMHRRSDHSTSWTFDVSYLNVAACSIYGYVLIVPLAYYFLLQYLGSNASLIRFWCLWGYSLFIFILSSVRICACSVFVFSDKLIMGHSIQELCPALANRKATKLYVFICQMILHNTCSTSDKTFSWKVLL